MKPLQIVAAIVVPPLGVFLRRGVSGAFWLSIPLTMAAFLPGMLFALRVVLSRK